MREILFRGKRVDNGEWIYGDVVQFSTHGIVRIVEQEPSYKDAEVDSETVGQYTGLTDKNGRKIFESIKEAVKETGLNQSGITSCCCGRYKQTGGYVFKYKYSCYKKTKQLISNIHDTPELLEVTE